MDDLSYLVSDVYPIMQRPFDSISEVVIELNEHGVLQSGSQGFQLSLMGDQNCRTMVMIDKYVCQLPSFLEESQHEYLGLINGIDSDSEVIYLIDRKLKLIDLFIFRQQGVSATVDTVIKRLNDVPKIDSEMFAALNGGEIGMNHNEFADLVNMFLSSISERLNTLTQATNSEHWQGVIAQAHYLKSSFGVLGLERLTWLVSELERAGKLGEQQKALATYRLIFPELLSACRFLCQQTFQSTYFS
jgi:HPt (histidine-containing phosphotransfer) domain-containing protein